MTEPVSPEEVKLAWSDEVSAIVDAAFERVSRNPSDYETALAYRLAILSVLTASGIETRRAETGTGSVVDESPARRETPLLGGQKEKEG